MPSIPKSKRPEPTLQSVEDFLYELGPEKEEKVTVEGIEFEINKFERKYPQEI